MRISATRGFSCDHVQGWEKLGINDFFLPWSHQEKNSQTASRSASSTSRGTLQGIRQPIHSAAEI